jgi:hypothetical protein
MAGIEQDLLLCEFGSNTFERMLRVFTRHLHGVRHVEDPEYIHRMRVSSGACGRQCRFSGLFPPKRVQTMAPGDMAGDLRTW